jgi:hypothetical protein
LSPDTIVSGAANPQAFNRYSYTLNNPLRYTDPSGHMVQNEADGGCAKRSACVPYIPPPLHPELPKRPPSTEDDEEDDETSIEPAPALIPNPITNYCEDSSSGLACLANAAQDIATLTDIVGVGLIETPAVAVGCFEGGPLGCVIAEVGVWATWNLTLNNVEAAASLASFGFTVLDDLSNNGGLGENSATSLATLAAGQLPLTPSWDLVVDTYASGYNHGSFNGVSTIWTDGFFK